MYSLVASAINHPDRVNRLWGLYNHRSLDALSRTGVALTAAVPRPHAPPIGPFSSYRRIPEQATTFTYPVFHPRFLYYLPKSLLYHRTGDSMASALESWFESENPSCDVLHGCHLYPDGYGLAELASDHDLPLTTYAHGTIINEFDEFNRPTRERIRTALGQSARIFCSGGDIQAKIGDIEPTASTQVTPLGATPAHFPTERRVELRQELNVPASATVVLYCGHLSEAKGVADLIDVLPALDDEELYVVCIGHGGDLKSELQSALAAKSTPPGQLHWKLPPVAVRRWFAIADLLVLPSYSEGRPTVIYEAMASRTPVLATRVGGVPEQVVDGTTGWLVEPGDTDALRVKLSNLSGEELGRMGRASERRLREQGWTWDAHAKAIIDVHTAQLGLEPTPLK
jgi:glycosyltransferase involved in cell wall biosynthesis